MGEITTPAPFTGTGVIKNDWFAGTLGHYIYTLFIRNETGIRGLWFTLCTMSSNRMFHMFIDDIIVF